jgi:hypothetical protein
MADELLSGSAILTSGETSAVQQAWSLLSRVVRKHSSIGRYMEEAPEHAKEDIREAMAILSDVHGRRVVRGEIPDQDSDFYERPSAPAIRKEIAATEERPLTPAAAVEPEVGTPEPVATTTPEPQTQGEPTVPAPEDEVGSKQLLAEAGLAQKQNAQEEASGPTSTGIKRATVEKELKAMGLPMPEKSERRGFVEVHAEAMAEMEANRDAGRDLVAELEADPRPLTDRDDALLTFEANRLVRARDKAEAAYDADPTPANKAKVDNSRSARPRVERRSRPRSPPRSRSS